MYACTFSTIPINLHTNRICFEKKDCWYGGEIERIQNCVEIVRKNFWHAFWNIPSYILDKKKLMKKNHFTYHKWCNPLLFIMVTLEWAIHFRCNTYGENLSLVWGMQSTFFGSESTYVGTYFCAVHSVAKKSLYYFSQNIVVKNNISCRRNWLTFSSVYLVSNSSTY